MDEQILKRYFAGKCSEKEKRQVESFLNETENLGDVLDDSFLDLWNNGKDFAKEEVFPSVLFSEIQSKIQSDNQRTITRDGKAKNTINFRSILKYAAVVTLVSSVAFFVSRNYEETHSTKTAQIDEVVKSTSRGQKSTILLSDGSKVILNSGSTLSYPRHFTDSSRVLELKGEAYFEVTKDVSRPFSVIANDIKTTALGTSFNINALDNQIKVSLATGKVVVQEDLLGQPEGSLFFLNPGESIKFDNISKEFKKSTFSYNEDFLWKDGILYFDNTSFEDIQERLSAWYDVQFTIQNKNISQKKYTGQFNNETLKNVLENMAFSLGFDYFLNGKKVEIIFNEKTKM